MTDEMLRRDDDRVTLLGRRTLANEISNKEETMSKSWQMASAEPTPKKPRTSEDFKLFCKFILEYENYDAADKDESQDAVENTSVNSVERAENSSKASDQEEHRSVPDSSSDDNDSFDLITCFCGKPFAGRPMIECSKCFTWIHLRCAKVKKSEIPEIFICSHCKDSHKK